MLGVTEVLSFGGGVAESEVGVEMDLLVWAHAVIMPANNRPRVVFHKMAFFNISLSPPSEQLKQPPS
jgi:hypothetical protein